MTVFATLMPVTAAIAYFDAIASTIPVKTVAILIMSTSFLGF
jgi:hypothetical protein